MNITKVSRALLVVATLALAPVGLAACGEEESAGGAGASTAGNGIDRAFVADMIPHHESAVEMAQVAEKRGQSTFVKDLADDIIRTQNAEITTMKTIASKLDAAGVKATSLGVPADQMGMDMNMSTLETADPFDREFIDMMIPHHQGAIRMARVELAKGSDPEAKKLAEDVVAAQSREIRAMNEHRKEAFGAVSPAGGIPPEGEAAKDDAAKDDGGAMGGMDHG